MPTAYQEFVSATLKKAPTNLKQSEKMKWCGEQWRSRKESKGGSVKQDAKGLKAKGLKAPGAKSGRGLKKKPADDTEDTPVGPPSKKKQTPKAKSVGKPSIKPDVFKETAKIAKVASKAGKIQDFINHAAMGGITTVRGRKGANLISIKNHK